MSAMESEVNVNLLSIVADHSPPSSTLLLKQEQQKVVEENEGEEENVAFRERPCMFEPLAPATNP